MGNSEIREPVQKRSIEKKEKIIQAGFELICDKGYYNTNTAEIAKAAGVSTGIVYQYFKDKHDILIEGVKIYANSIFYPIHSISDKEFDKNNLDETFRKIISAFIKNHKLSQTAHEEIVAMQHSDKEIAELFYKSEIEMTNNIEDLFIKNGFNCVNLREKVHLIIHLIDDLCHEIVYHKHPNMDYNAMTNIIIDSIINLLKF